MTALTTALIEGLSSSVQPLLLQVSRYYKSKTANAQTKQPETRVLDDPKVQHGRVTFKHNGAATIDGYLARPKAEGIYPAVLVIAGNKISEEYIPNTCAALALAGFVGLGSKHLSSFAGRHSKQQ